MPLTAYDIQQQTFLKNLLNAGTSTQKNYFEYKQQTRTKHKEDSLVWLSST
jgi:hypothetical protein